jgi:hypothetical protein
MILRLNESEATALKEFALKHEIPDTLAVRVALHHFLQINSCLQEELVKNVDSYLGERVWKKRRSSAIGTKGIKAQVST